jgi:hypothetical protein
MVVTRVVLPGVDAVGGRLGALDHVGQVDVQVRVGDRQGLHGTDRVGERVADREQGLGHVGGGLDAGLERDGGLRVHEVLVAVAEPVGQELPGRGFTGLVAGLERDQRVRLVGDDGAGVAGRGDREEPDLLVQLLGVGEGLELPEVGVDLHDHGGVAGEERRALVLERGGLDVLVEQALVDEALV